LASYSYRLCRCCRRASRKLPGSCGITGLSRGLGIPELPAVQVLPTGITKASGKLRRHGGEKGAWHPIATGCAGVLQASRKLRQCRCWHHKASGKLRHHGVEKGAWYPGATGCAGAGVTRKLPGSCGVTGLRRGLGVPELPAVQVLPTGITKASGKLRRHGVEKGAWRPGATGCAGAADGHHESFREAAASWG
jgi:hypothetical protein